MIASSKLFLGALSILIGIVVVSEIANLRPQHLQYLLTGSVERITSAIDTTTYLNNNHTIDADNYYSYYADFCIGIISLNGFGTNDHGLLQRLVRSIRQTGDWPRGRILIVTDDHLRNDSAFQDFVQRDGHISVEYVPRQRLQEIQDQAPRPTSKTMEKDNKNMAAKRFKTDLLHLMSKHSTSNATIDTKSEYMLYIDSDVVIGEPLQHFFDAQ
ncbi:MAG: hypothetical protein SGARI_003474 [Bacillariaceae sp.]